LPDSDSVATWSAFILRNWALISMLTTLAILIVVPSLVLRKYIRIMLNIIKDTPPPLSRDPRDYVRIEGESVNFRAFDGVSLRGMFLFSGLPSPSKGMIIFAHEFASDMYSCARYCRPLLEAGYDVFTFDFRGHGKSSDEEGYVPRQWATDRELKDMVGALAFVEDWLEQQGRAPEVGLFGISRGACAGVIAAVHNPRVRALLCDGLFSTDVTLEYLMKRWAYIFAKVRFVYENHPPQFWQYLRWRLLQVCRRKFGVDFPSVRKALKRMPARPILLVHGERDSYIPVEQARFLHELAPEPNQLWIVNGAKHNQSVIHQPKEYARRTVEFFDRHLASLNAAYGETLTQPA
jgi:pimeloyl-ACP methyl ester carboxylesterase